MKVWEKDQKLLLNSLAEGRRLAAITGAGISVSAGLPLGGDEFEGVAVEEILSRSYFVRRPAQFYRWYRHCLREWSQVAPTTAHQVLKEWEVDVITQNIDNLHESSGGGHVIEMHGSTRSLYCPRCRQRFPNRYQAHLPVPLCPTCNNLLHPDIVFVGEPVRHFSQAVDLTCRAQILLIIGTQLNMQPCASLAEIAERNHTRVVYINEDADQFLAEVHRQVECQKRLKQQLSLSKHDVGRKLVLPAGFFAGCDIGNCDESSS